MNRTDFSDWARGVLEKFARESADRMREQEAAIEQLRGDLHAAMELIRQLNKGEKQ